MKKEQLETLGLTPSQIETVIAINKADLQLLSENYLKLIANIIKTDLSKS